MENHIDCLSDGDEWRHVFLSAGSLHQDTRKLPNHPPFVGAERPLVGYGPSRATAWTEPVECTQGGGGRDVGCYTPRMSKDLWIAVDRYMEGALLQPDSVLEAALEANAAAGLPAIDVAPNQGKLLYLIAQMLGARSILEIGPLGR